MSATPSRVLPGLKMAGHMGAERVKIRKLEVSFLQACHWEDICDPYVCGSLLYLLT